MEVPAAATLPVASSTTVQVPPGYTINGQRVPAQGLRYQPGAARTHYERPRVIENRPVRGQEASRYRQYIQRHGLGRPRNVGRQAETSFSNPPESSGSPIDSVARNTEGIRQRRPIQRQGTSGSSRVPVRPNASTPRPADTRISIEPLEVSESVPLLGAAGGASVSGGITGSTLATGAGLVGGALGLGAATSAVVNRIKEKGAVLPGRDYIGPGNDIRIDAPRSGADAIAKEHDIDYENLTYQLRAGKVTTDDFIKNIQHADRTAVEKFAEWYDTTGDWDAFIGKYGLGAKRWIESVVGHVYPFIPGKCLVNSITFLPTKDLIGIA